MSAAGAALAGACAVGVLGALAACRGGAVARLDGAAGEGRLVVIHAARDGVTPGRALVDERRWLVVPADGEVNLGPVVPQLELDSVVIESVSDAGGLRARSCHVASIGLGLAEPAWLWGRTVTVTLGEGGAVTGEVIEVGEPVAVIDDGASRTRVAVAAVHHDNEGGEPPDRAPRTGDAVYAIDDEGEETFGTFAAVIPDRLVVRVAGEAAPRVLDPDDIVRLAVAGVPAEPTLRCAVTSPRPGRHLVRLAYATPGLRWRVTYQVLLAGAAAVDEVSLVPAYDITADGVSVAWPAHVQLVLGLPGEPEPPVTSWDGDATLGAGPVHVAGAPVTRAARVELVYRGAVGGDDEGPQYPGWHDASAPTVWRELAFARSPADAAGPLRVGLRDPGPDGAIRWLDGELPPVADAGEAAAVAVRVELTADPELVGFRRKSSRDPDGTRMVDDITFSVANRGARPSTVIVEEELRPGRQPTLLYARVGDGPGTGDLLPDRWRATVTVAPGALVQGQLVLAYRARP